MLQLEIHSSVREIGYSAWSRIGDPAFPFCDYHYLDALETSDCVGPRTGWFPQYIAARRGPELVGAAVLYVKTNSYGEYIFDFAWGEAFERCGLAYFPKLTSAVPFTPATGSKLMVCPGENVGEVHRALLGAADALATQVPASSVHALFVPESQRETYLEAGYFLRDSFQFHWHNRDYRTFADFLSGLRGKRRKEIVRERAQVGRAPVQIRRLTGTQITPAHASLFYRFYISTIDKRSSYDYLTQDFFKNIFANMRDRLLLVLAEDASHSGVAGALFYFGDGVLYGRNWGCVEEFRSLHFELCYYQGIEFAIERGFGRFEAGAQGEHKFQRGFLPSLTYSAHKVQHPELGKAIRDHVSFERKEIARQLADYIAHSPFRNMGPICS